VSERRELRQRFDKGVKLSNRDEERDCPEKFDLNVASEFGSNVHASVTFMLQHEFRAVTVTQLEAPNEPSPSFVHVDQRQHPPQSSAAINQILWMYCVHCRRMTAPSYAEAVGINPYSEAEADGTDDDSDDE
tara:strand:- start:587 stop:982 length:396 start_codon:yes stop_codon:yes gene_type:complete